MRIDPVLAPRQTSPCRHHNTEFTMSFVARTLVRVAVAARISAPRAAPVAAVFRPVLTRSLATAAPAGGQVQVRRLGGAQLDGGGVFSTIEVEHAYFRPSVDPLRSFRSVFLPTLFGLTSRRVRLLSFSRPPQTFLDRKEVTERVLQVLKNFEKVDPAKVTPTAHFVNDLGLDSLDAVEVRRARIVGMTEHDRVVVDGAVAHAGAFAADRWRCFLDLY